MRAAIYAIATAASLLAACGIPNPDAFAPVVDASVNVGPPDADVSKPLLVVSAPNTAVNEGQSIDVTVALNLTIMNAVTVSTTVEDGIVAEPSTLSFLPSEKVMTPKKITIRALPDENTANSTPKITFKADGYPDATLTINVTDIDKVLIVTNVDTLGNKIGVDEDNDNTITVKLSAPPPGDIVVTATATNPGVISVTASQTLTAANYKDGKGFVIHGTKDANTTDEDTAITFKADGLPSRVIDVHVSDKDKQGLKVDPLTLPIVEGNVTGGTVDIALQQQPAGTTTVDITVPPGLHAAPAQLTFTTGNWDRNQTVRITSDADDNTDDSSATVNVKCAALALQKDVTVNIDDPNVQSIVSTDPNAAFPSSLPLDEGTFENLNVRLKFRPRAGQTVVLSVVSTNGSASVSPSQLSFDSNNFASTKAVKVTAIDDNDMADKDAKVRIKSDTIPQVETDVPVTNKDVQAIQVSIASNQTLQVPEGGTAEFTARLAFNPINDTNASVESANLAIGADPSTLTFTSGVAGNWNAPHKVTLNAPRDSNQVHETSDITLRIGGMQAVVHAQVGDTTMTAEIGWPNDFVGGAGTFLRNSVVTFKVTTTEAFSLDDYKVINRAATGNARMALYDHDSSIDQPGAVRAFTSSFPLTLPFSHVAVTPVSIPPGTYWLAVVVDQQTWMVGQSGGASARRCVAQISSFAGLFPSGASANWSCLDANLINISASGVK